MIKFIIAATIINIRSGQFDNARATIPVDAATLLTVHKPGEESHFMGMLTVITTTNGFIEFLPWVPTKIIAYVRSI